MDDEKKEKEIVKETTVSVEESPPPTDDAPLVGRAKMAKMLRDKYPDRDFDDADDDALFGLIDEDYADIGGRLSGYEEQKGKLLEAFSKNPEAGMFFADVLDGMPLIEALTSNYGDIVASYGDDEEAKAAYSNGLNRYNEKVSQVEDIIKNQDENAKKNGEAALAFVKDKFGDDEEAAEKFTDFISELCNKIYLLDLDTDTLSKLYNAYTYDDAVTDAELIGEVRGRNQKIEVMKKDTSDGLPNIGNAGDSVETNKNNDRQFLGRRRKSVWST